MIKRLRRQFRIATMLVVTVILLVALCTAYAIFRNVHDSSLKKGLEAALRSPQTTMQLGNNEFKQEQTNSQATEAMPSEASEDGQASAQEGQNQTDNVTSSDSTGSDASSDSESDELGNLEPNPGNCAVYELRDGLLVKVSSGNVSISDQAVAQLQSEITDYDDGFGSLTDLGLYYMKSTNPDGIVQVAFADKASSDTSLHTSIFVLIGLGAVVWIGCFVMSYFLSRWMTKPVQEAWEQQQRFVTDASHDLKTPLAVILANNSILVEHPEQTIGENMRWVESTQEEGEKMQGLINDMLFLAAPATSQSERLVSRIDLSDLCERSVLQFEAVAYEKGLTLTSDVAKGIFIEGTESRIERLVSTLVDNACKYADTGGSVHLELVTCKRMACLSVSNTGKPIAAEDLPHIFERFYRADKARTSGTGGFGLGLSIAKDVCEEHGGTIRVTDHEGYVTTLTAELPLA
jgi:two-component system sensor histidine kinase CiaH